MKRKITKVLMVLLLVALIMVPTGAAIAATMGISTVTDGLSIALLAYSTDGIQTQPNKCTWYSNDRHWAIYLNDDTDLVYASSEYGSTWTETTIVASTLLYGFEYATWYDETTETLHYTRHDLDTDSTMYRMGVPGDDGVITWSAVEQTVSATPSNLVSYRVVIAVDEAGFPWVAWIDDDNVTTDVGLVYVERSSTKNGTWTQDVAASETFVFGGGTIVDTTGTLGGAGSPITLTAGANAVAVTTEGTFTVTLPEGTTGTAVSDGWTVTNSPLALTEGDTVITVEAGGGGNITINTTEARHDWFLSLTPANNDGDIMEVQWSAENVSGGANDGEVGLYAKLYNTATGWDAIDTIVSEGSMNATRSDSFSVYDIGAALYCVYTDVDGKVMFRARSQIQTWAGASAAAQIKAAGITLYIPTLSGLSATETGENLICIVHDNIALLYSIYDFDTSTWGSWNVIWQVPDVSNDSISRHVASYKYSSPVGFAWQWTDDSETTDTVYYWWIDGTNNQFGYYNSPFNDAAEPMVDLLPFIMLAMAIIILLGMVLSGDGLSIPGLLLVVIFVFIAIGMLAGINANINALFGW